MSHSVTETRGLLRYVFSAAMLTFPVGAQAADYDVGSIHITQPWSHATPKGAIAGAGYAAAISKLDATRN